MTQDCLNSQFAVDVSKSLPKGIHVIGAENFSAPKVEGISKSKQDGTSEKVGQRNAKKTVEREDPSTLPTSWSYLFIRHMTVKKFQKRLESYNADDKNEYKQPFFIHQSFRYYYKNKEEQQGVKKVLQPTVSGLVFLQGTVRDIQRFLATYFPMYHLVNDRSQGRPASIRDSIMQPFMNVMKTNPKQVTFLREPFEKFAKEHVKLRVLTGQFKGYEGYIVRIDRDRQLVFDIGGRAVALRGVHNEDFEVAE